MVSDEAVWFFKIYLSSWLTIDVSARRRRDGFSRLIRFVKWGRWDKKNRRWQASYKDANGKHRRIGRFDTQEAAAHAYNAAIRALPPDVQVRRNTNPVVDGQLVPKPSRKRSRAEEPAAAPTRRSARRSRQE